MSTIDLKGTTIRLRDGTPTTPNYIDVKIGEGTLTWNEKREIHFNKSRGDLDTVRIGDDIETDVAFQFEWSFITASSGDPPTVEDVLKHRGAAASWLSATPITQDPDAPFSINIDILYTPICGDVEPENYIFPQYHYTSLAHDIRNGTVDCQGQMNSTEPIVTRVE